MFHFKTSINSQLLKIWGLVILAIAIPVTFNSCKAFIAATEDGMIIQSSELSTLKDLQGQAVSGSEIRLSWSVTTAGQMAYSIFRNDQYIATTTDALFTDTGLSSNTAYTYKVYAADITTGDNSASGVIVISTLESGQTPVPPIPAPTPDPGDPTPAPTEPPPVCTAGSTTKINCTSQIPYASSASITKTCKADGSGYTQTTCQLESCLSSHEISGNTCVDKQAPPSGVSVSYSEDGGKTYSLLNSNSVMNNNNLTLKFDNLEGVRELRVYCCKAFDAQNKPIGDHTISKSKIVYPTQPTMSLDLSSITQDYSRELYFDAVKTDGSRKSQSKFFNLSQQLLSENNTQTPSPPSPSPGGGTPPPTTEPGDKDGFTLSMTFDGGTSGELIQSYTCENNGEPVFTSDGSRTVYTSETAYGSGKSAKLTIEKGKKGFGSFGGIVKFSSCDRYGGRNVTKGDELWVRLRIKFPSGFEFNRNGRNKFLRLRTFQNGGGSEGYNDLYINAPPGLNPGKDQPFHYIFEGIQQWHPMGEPSDFFKPDTWHTIEYYLKLDNVKGSQGGSSMVRAWVDGRLIGESNDRANLLRSDSYIESLYLFTYWDNDGAHRTQSLYVDDLVITTKTPSARDSYGNPMVGH